MGAMRDLAVLFLHLLATVARLAGPGGARAVVAESVLIKQQLLILNRSRKRSLFMANYKLLKDFAIRQAGSCRPSMSRIERSGSTIEAAHPAKATGNPECGRLPAAAECADGSPRRRGRTVCRISIALPYARLAALDG
jgi:hypothetical protein